MDVEHTISVIPAEYDVTRGLGRPVKINIDALSNNVKEFVGQIGEVLKSIPDSCEGFELAEFEFNAEVSAKGTLSLLGTGGEVAGKGGLKFVFRRTVRKP
jgi:hypothetical protein